MRQALNTLFKIDATITLKQVHSYPSKKNIQEIVIPSEEHKINVYPMDYEEFMWAIGKEPAIIREIYKAKTARIITRLTFCFHRAIR